MNRRRMLGATMTMLYGAALSPPRAVGQALVSTTVMEVVASYMSGARARPLPVDVAEQSKHHLLDSLAAMVSGSELSPGQAAQRYIRAHGGRGSATIAGTALTASPSDAALANGVMAHADETDDSHNGSRSHPGS